MMAADKTAERHEPKPPPTVLIVEDDLLVRIANGEFLRDCGFNVIEVGNAAEAFTVLDSPSRHVDVLFTDVRLPGPMDGFGLAQWLRINRPEVKIILTSGIAHMDEDAARLCAESQFMLKPYYPDEIERRIRMVLDEGNGSVAT
jgi:DNA-binding response OmpR family regulator